MSIQSTKLKIIAGVLCLANFIFAETLSIRHHVYPETLDCHTYYAYNTHLILCDMYSGLFRMDKEDQLQYDLCSCAKRMDSYTWKFILRPSQWSDGTLITAHDFVNSWNRLKDPQTHARFLGAMQHIASYHALDNQTLIVKTVKPNPQFHNILTHSTLFAFKPRVYSGAYVCQNKTHDITLQKNPYYWNHKAVYFDQVNHRIVPNDSTAKAMFQQSLLDLSPIQKNYAPTHQFRTREMHYLMFNHHYPIFKNPNIRKALNHLINKQELCQIIGAKPTSYLFPSQTKDTHSYQKKQAISLLKSCGYSLNNPLKLTYSYQNREEEEMMAVFLKNTMLPYVELNLEKFDKNTFMHKKQKQQLQFFKTKWLSVYHDLEDYANLLYSKSLTNESGYRNTVYDQAVDQQNYKKAEQIALREMACIPVYAVQSTWLIKDSLGIHTEQFHLTSVDLSRTGHPYSFKS